MGWFVGMTCFIIGMVVAAMTLAWQWADQRQVDSYDQTRIDDMFNDITSPYK